MKGFLAFLGVVALIVVLIFAGLFVHGCSVAVGTAHKAIDVTAAQFDPATMLKRYEWFKDASAQLDKKSSDILVYENRFKQLSDSYNGAPRREWAREDRDQFNIWSSEVSGVIASYNGLAAEYNSAMSKMNYRFTNIGELPKGATEPLPREYKPYKNQ